MVKSCKRACNKSYNNFKKLHFKSKNNKNCGFINATEIKYKKTCKRLCNKAKAKTKAKKKQTKRKQTGGTSILPVPIYDAVSMVKYVPMNFLNSLKGFSSLVNPAAGIGHFI